jgi:aspartyl-tRNA(Asn)/glutamyl-tRNA(Gln) amidotransferase subunit C
MSITEQEVRKVALLARLEVDEKEISSLKQHFDSILEHFNMLNELDLDDIDPFVMQDAQALLRDDKVETWQNREDALAEAPHREGDFFRVPRIVGEEG